MAENREEPFDKETKTYYTRTDDDRSRYDNWRKKMRSGGFNRSGSNPKYFRTASKSKYECEPSSRYAINGSRYERGRSGSRFERSKSRTESTKRSFSSGGNRDNKKSEENKRMEKI